jgi:hypothetical protein
MKYPCMVSEIHPNFQIKDNCTKRRHTCLHAALPANLKFPLTEAVAPVEQMLHYAYLQSELPHPLHVLISAVV